MRLRSLKHKFVFYKSETIPKILKLYNATKHKHFLTSFAFIKNSKDLPSIMETIGELQSKDPEFLLMLDSGAYSNFFSDKGKVVNDNEYIEFIDKYKDYFDEIIMLDSPVVGVNEKKFESLYKGKAWYVDHTNGKLDKYPRTKKIWEKEKKVGVSVTTAKNLDTKMQRAYKVIHKKESEEPIHFNQIADVVYNASKEFDTKVHLFGTYSPEAIMNIQPHSVDIALGPEVFGGLIALEKVGKGLYTVKRYHEKDNLPPKINEALNKLRQKYSPSMARVVFNVRTFNMVERLVNENKFISPKEYRQMVKKEKVEEALLFETDNISLKEGIYIPEDINDTSSNFLVEGFRNKQTISSEKEQITYIPHYVSLVGSRARGDYDENSDWDILIRKQERDEALELLIRRTLGEDKEYHFIYSPYGPHGTYIPLFDLKLIRVKEQKPILIEAYTFRPLKNYTPPKMGSAYSFEEFYDIDELVEKWAKPFLERGMGLYVEKKLNGWRATIHKKDSKVGIFFEGTNDNRDKQFLKFSNLLKKIPEDFILDCEFSAKEVKTKKIIPRKDLAGWGHNPDKTIDIDEFETPSGVKARLSIMLFDIPYLNIDISKEPLKERRKILEDFYKGLPQELKKYMEIVPYFYVETVEDLKKAIQEVSRMEMSEGAVVKSSTSIYLPEEIPSWAKFKKIVEIKVEVMKKLKTKDGRAFNYVVGYLDDGEVKELCKTMNTKVDAEIGDIITLSAEEIIIKQDKEGNIEIGIQIPRVRDIDLNRKRPDTLEEIIQKGYKGGILQATSELISELKSQKILESKEGDTGGDWKADFMVWFEKGSKGKFVLQEHERGLSEKLAKTGRRYSGSENIHCDLRFRILRPKPLSFLVGITLATPSKPNEPNKIVEPDKGKILVVGFKKFQPISWLDVGKGKIDLGGGHVKMKLYGKEFIADINTPGGVGSTKNTWSRFVAIDEGDFEVVDKGNHHILFKFNSKNGFLDGYWVLGGAPLDIKNQNLPKFGNRVWFFQKSAKNSDIMKQEEKE